MTTLRPVNPDYRPARLETLDPLQLQDRPVPERRWIVPAWVPHGQTTLLTGDGGIGKTIVAMGLATSCATGQPWFGQVAMRCKALVVLCEDDEDEIARRQDCINRYLGLQFGDLEDLMIVPRIGRDNSLMAFDCYDRETQAKTNEPTEFFQQIHDAASDFGAQLIVLDSLHDFFAGNENSRIHARTFIQLLTSLARDCDGATFLCGHPSLDGLRSGSGTAGSTAWNNAVRSRLYLTKSEDDEAGDRRILTRMKANYAARGAEILLTYRDGNFIADEVTGVRAASRASRCETVFLDLLARMEGMGRAVSVVPQSSNYAPRLFERQPEREGFERRDFERAMEALLSQGRVRNEEYGRPGDTRRRLAAVPSNGAADG